MATDNAYTTPEDTPVSGNVITDDTGSGVDYDPEGDPLTVDHFTVDGVDYPAGSTAHLPEGDLTINADGSYTFVPAPDYNGTLPETITYTVSDGNGGSDSANVTITVTPVNDLPSASDDAATTPINTPVTVPVLDNDDFGGDGPSTGTISVVTAPQHGTATVDDGGTPNDPTDDTIVYTPDPGYTGTDSFDYQICDSNGDCVTATVTITVVPDADLSVIKEADAEVRAGEVLEYTLTVINDGPADATGTTLVDVVPAALLDPEYSLDDGATWQVWNGQVDLGTVASGERRTVLLRGQIDPEFSGELENVAGVSSDLPDPNPDNNEDGVVTQVTPRPMVEMLLEKSVTPTAVRVGETLTYTIAVHNPSDVSVTFDLMDLPDEHLSYVAGSATPAEPEAQDGRLVWRDLELDAGATMIVAYRMRVLAGAPETLSNIARVRSQAYDTYLVAEAQSSVTVALEDAMFADRSAVVTGRVFLDADRDGAFDAGRDVPLAGARVVLTNGRQAFTDAQGRYAFRDVPPGVWQVVLDARSAPFEPLPHPEASEGGYAHRVNAWGLTVSDFPLAAPRGIIEAMRSTAVRLGPITLTKTIVPLGDQGYRVVLYLKSTQPVTGLVVEDPLPDGEIKRIAIGVLDGERTVTYDLEGKPVMTDPELRWRGQ